MTDLDQTIDTLADELAEIIIKGGPTSGNWGHSGRKGKKGGSGGGGGFRRIGVKDGKAGRKGIKRASRQTRAKDERGKGDAGKAKKISGSLNKREKKALSSFKNEGKLGIDIASIPGTVKGKKVTKVGADTINKLSNSGLVRQTSLIGPSGFPRMKVTDLGKKVMDAGDQPAPKPKPKKPAKPKSEPLGKLTSSQDKLVNLGVEKLKVSRNKVLSDAKKVSDAFGRAGEGVDNSSAIGNALQMISAGGLDKWMDKFGKESIMRQTIEPELRKEFG